MTRNLSFSNRQSRTRRGGFTLFEILVVLAIAAVVTGITVGGFKEMRAGNKRVACSTNLTQIYQAARLYAADEDGKFPHFLQDDCSTNPDDHDGIGLWALYTFPDAGEEHGLPLVDTKPINRYIRSSKVFQCPAHLNADGDRESLYTDETKEKYNFDYLSYQTCDDDGSPTYASSRIDLITDPELWKRQLIHFKVPTDETTFVSRQPTGDTIVTYCIHHRHERGKDNVLFYDGTIQQIDYNPGVAGWKREPKEMP